ncbi:3-carboxy-cis,cis-muconate cycloisomerase [Brucella sp. TWI559]
MSISVFNHAFQSGLFGDDEVARAFEASCDVREMLRFEGALANAQAQLGIVPSVSAKTIAEVAAGLQPDMDALKRATARDGVVVPELVRQLRHAVGEHYAAHVHLGVTSQDVIDTSLILRLKQVFQLFDQRLTHLIERFDQLDQVFGGVELTGYTRMQVAIPIRVSDRIGAWRAPLARHLQHVRSLQFPLQFGGAVGTLDKFGEYAAPLRAALATMLGLNDVPQWQTQRDYVVAFANALSSITGSLGKFGQDIVLMAEIGDEISIRGGGGSSAMPHKQNPVEAEVLVSLARFNAIQVSAMHQSLVHEQERSGAAWTLEWMILPQMAAATAAALNMAANITQNIISIGKKNKPQT